MPTRPNRVTGKSDKLKTVGGIYRVVYTLSSSTEESREFDNLAGILSFFTV
jgi:hypothetical protein